MKNLVIIVTFLSYTLTFGQHLRLDSLIHYNLSYNHDNYVMTYSYITDRDFTIHKKYLKDRLVDELVTIIYMDSLIVRSFSDNIVDEYRYDEFRREIYSSVTINNSSIIEKRKSYWKDTNLLTMQEETFLIKKDTVKYTIRLFNYDDQDRVIESHGRTLNELGKESRSNTMTEYEGDSIIMEEMNLYNEGKGWDHSTIYTQYYPKIFYGDTVCTTYSQWNPDTQTKESTRCTKYEWGKPGTNSDWGYIAYRYGNIYGKINDYTDTDHGYMWTGYESRSEKGPNKWREDLKSRFQLTGTRCVTLNEYDLPAVDESFDVTGVLQNRTEYYYKEADDFSNRPFSELTSCKIIRELNPVSVYYDLTGRIVTRLSGNQYLLEKSKNQINRVLYLTR